jgi:hypothetical protein
MIGIAARIIEMPSDDDGMMSMTISMSMMIAVACTDRLRR